MGHIINAKSMRIGWSALWCDQWYSEILYYSEFLHAMFRIRFYCIYTFTRRHLDKKAIFYSHFEILKSYKNIYVEIYYYDGKLESDYEDFKFEFFIKAYNLEINKDPETRIPHFLHMPLKLLLIFRYVEWFNYDKWSNKEIGSLAFLLRKYKIIKLLKYFSKLKKRGFFLSSYFNVRFLTFLSLFLHTRDSISKWSIWKQPRRNTTLRRFYMAAFALAEILRFIEPFVILLGYTFQKLSKFWKVKVNFYLINNNSVNAKFLSRFIARKLKQNYPVKELLNPIRKELVMVIKMTALPPSCYFATVDKKYIIAVNNKITRNNVFKTLLNSLFIIYNKNLLIYFLKYKTWFTLDFVIIYSWLNFNINNVKLLINVTHNYFIRKCAYLCFFENRVNIDSGNFLFFPKVKFLSYFSQKYKFLGFFDFIFSYLYVSKSCLLNMNVFDYLSGFSLKSFRSSNIHFNRYLKFNYWNYNYGWSSEEFKINHLKSRIKLHTTAYNLRGYKMHLLGRFSRKQRAGSYWFSKGKVPLNSIDSFIDYAYFTLSLANSVITVKVWLYKTNDIDNIYFYKLN